MFMTVPPVSGHHNVRGQPGTCFPLQGPLVALAPRLAAYTKPGGLLGLSGVCGMSVYSAGKASVLLQH